MAEAAPKDDPFDIVEDPEGIIDGDESSELSEGLDGAQEPEAEEADNDEAKALRKEIEDLRRQQLESIEELKRQQQQTEEQAKIEREQAEARERFEASRSTRLGELDSKLADLRAKRREADDDADEARIEDLEEQIAEVRFKRAAIKQTEFQEQWKPARTPKEDELAPAASAWLALNPEFHSDKDFHARALAENRKLLDEGMDLSDPKFYRELDRRLAVQDPKDTGKAQPSKPTSVAGVSRGNPAGKTPSGRKFTEKDKAGMIKYGFGDPSNAEDRKNWLKFKGGRGL